MRTSLLFTLACLGCADGASTLIVTLDAQSPVSNIDHFRVKVSDLTHGRMSTPVDLPAQGRPASVPPEQSVAVRFGASVSGTMYVVVEARDADDRLLDSGGVPVGVEPSRSIAARVTLGVMAPLPGTSDGDGGASDGGDGDLAPGAAHLTLAPDGHDFGDALINAAGGAALFTLTNAGGARSGALVATMSGTNASDFIISDDQCSGGVLEPSGFCTLVVTFRPGTTGAKAAALQVGTASATLSGNALAPGSLSIGPSSSQLFDATVVGTATAAVQLTVSNQGDSASGPLSTSLSGNDAGDFLVSADGCNSIPLGAQASCTLSVSFKPLMAGTRTATLTVKGSPGGAVIVDLSGSGVTSASLSFTMNAGYAFPVTDVSGSSPVSLQVTNGGGQMSGMLTTTLSGDRGDFTVTDGCQGITLGGGSSCVLMIGFQPGSHGPKSLGVAVSASPGGAPATTLTGLGRDAPTLSVARNGSGSGTVTASGGGAISTGTGIDCGIVCSDSYYRTTDNPTVTLTAAPDTGSLISGWSVAGCGTQTTCDVPLAASTNVTVSFTLATYLLTVTNTTIAGKSGVITSASTPTPATEINCPSTCQVSLSYGTSVTLTAKPSANAFFGGWSGDCTGFSSCTLIIDGAKNVTGAFTPANLVFATSAQYTLPQIAALGSGATNDAKMLSGADAACATAAGSKGTAHFTAWISGGVGAAARLAGSASGNSNPRGWLRPDGKPFADDLASLTGALRVFYPASLDENGVKLTPSRVALTGTGEDGLAPNGETCVDWTSTSHDDFIATGEVGSGNSRWSAGDESRCDDSSSTFSLYCFQTDYSALVPPPTPPVSRRRIFNSSQFWDPTTGLAAADALCASLATAQSYPGSYQALLATNGASAASRFTAHTLPVVRPDGVIVAATDNAFFGAGFVPDAMFTLTEQGQYVTDDNVITGGGGDLSVAGTAASTCYGTTSWSSASGTAGMATGNWDRFWFFFSQSPCAPPMTFGTIYCLQE